MTDAIESDLSLKEQITIIACAALIAGSHMAKRGVPTRAEHRAQVEGIVDDILEAFDRASEGGDYQLVKHPMPDGAGSDLATDMDASSLLIRLVFSPKAPVEDIAAGLATMADNVPSIMDHVGQPAQILSGDDHRIIGMLMVDMVKAESPDWEAPVKH